MEYDRFKYGTPKEGSPDGYVKFTNGESGFVRQLCAKDPKLLDIVGSDLVNDWTRYCELPRTRPNIPDPRPGCLAEFVIVDYEYKATVVSAEFPDPEGTELTYSSTFTHWQGQGQPSVSVGIPELGTRRGLLIFNATQPCQGVFNNFAGPFDGDSNFGDRIISVNSANITGITPFLTASGVPITQKCCEDIPDPDEQTEYIRRGTYTRSEWLRYVLPEIIQMFLPNPFSVGRGIGRGFGFVDDLGPINFTRPVRTPVKPRPGKPLPTRDLPSRRPRPLPAPPPRRAPRPGKPLPGFPRPRQPIPPVPRPSPRPVAPPLPNVPQRRPLPVEPRRRDTPYPNVRPPSVPRPKVDPQNPPVRVPSPSPWRPARPARPPQRVPFTPRVPSPMIRPRPVPSPRPAPPPRPVPSPSPIPSPQKPGVPQRRPAPNPTGPRPSTPPRPFRPSPSPLPSRPGQKPFQPPSRTPFPQTQPRPSPSPYPAAPPSTPYRPQFVPPIPVPSPKLDAEGVPQVPTERMSCPPCPVVINTVSVPVMIPGPKGEKGEKGDKGDDAEGGPMAVLISENNGQGVFAQTLDFTGTITGKASGTLPRNISRVVLRYGEISPSTPIYGVTETGEKIGGFGTVALVLNDVIVSQYSLNRFQDLQIMIPYSVDQTVEVFVSPTASCKVSVLDEGDRWMWVRVSDPENLPEVSSSQLN